MSGINQRYHSKRIVRCRGAKLAGWSPKDVAKLMKRSKEGPPEQQRKAL